MEPEYPQRLRTFRRFKDLLTRESSMNTETIQTTSINIERAIFNYALGRFNSPGGMAARWDKVFKWLYINRAVTMYTNLDPKGYIKNVTLMNRLEQGEFTCQEMCFFTWKELCPGRHSHYKVDPTEVMAPVLQVDDNGLFRCGKCKSSKTSYYELQIRSADEPMTAFITCHNCGNKWRQ